MKEEVIFAVERKKGVVQESDLIVLPD